MSQVLHRLLIPDRIMHAWNRGSGRQRGVARKNTGVLDIRFASTKPILCGCPARADDCRCETIIGSSKALVLHGAIRAAWSRLKILANSLLGPVAN